MKYDIFFDPDTHTYLVDGQEVPSVTTILNYMSDVEYGKVNPAVLEQAARRGTLVHEYTELYDYDALPDEIEYEVAPYIQAYMKFIRDYKPNWILIEGQVYNDVYNYAGTVDRIGDIDGELAVVDIKTLASPTKMQKFTVSAQTEAYRRAYIYMLMDDELIPASPIHRYALYLGKDGEYNLVDLDEYDKKYGYDSWGMFLICLEMYKRIQTLKGLKPIKKGEKNGK